MNHSSGRFDSRSLSSGFFAGLIESSTWAVVTMLVVTILALAIPAMLITETYIRDHGMEVLPKHAEDFDSFVTVRALQLRRHSPEAPLIAITGGSTVLDAIAVMFLEQGLSKAGLGKIEVYKLTTTKQSLWDSMAMLDNIPRGSTGVAIIGIQPGVFTADSDTLKRGSNSGRLGFRSALLDEEFKRFKIDVSPRTGIYVFDNLKFILPRIGQAASNILTDNPGVLDERIRLDRPTISEKDWRIRALAVSKKLENYHANSVLATSLITRIVKELRENTNVEPILLEAPVNPKFLQEYSHVDLYATHAKSMSEFARSINVPYVNLNSAVSMKSDDFFDWAHLTDSNVVRATSQVAADAALLILMQQANENGR